MPVGPDEFRLRVIAKQLLRETLQGSVANRQSTEQINALRSKGRELLDTVSDRRTRPLFLTADGFYPFWLRTQFRPVSSEELAPGQASAKEAVEIGARNR